jgi:hypothetical protein
MALSKVTNDLLALGENTSSLNLPKGTTAQRPSSPVAGMVRENTDDNVIEYYNGTVWKQVVYQGQIVPVDIEYLLVAGGGGGGYAGEPNPAGDGAGGGGAGGYLLGSLTVNSETEYSIIVGAGGVTNTNGENTTAFNRLAVGGGSGGSDVSAGASIPLSTGKNGGSGGGASANCGNSQPGGSGTSGQGNSGGSTTGCDGGRNGAGGGGAGAAGQNGNGGGSGGGIGVQLSITGANAYYAGGGGGGSGGSANNAGAGGLGGGGNGANLNSSGFSGTANTGGGGGGDAAGSGGSTGGSGGSGVVILKVLTSEYSGSTTGNPTVTTNGSHTILKYTTSGTYTP